MTFSVSLNVLSYDVVGRFKTVQDKLATDELFRPIGHDFVFEVGASLNADITDVIDDAEKAADTPGSESDKIAAATTFLRKYENTEQNVRVNFKLGFPLPSFMVGNTKLRPNIRAIGDVGFILGIRKDKVDFSNILELVGNEIPQVVKNKILELEQAGSFVAGNDMVSVACTSLGLPLNTPACPTEYLNKYFYPDEDIPNIFALGKAQAKAGMFNNFYNKKHGFFGKLNAYAMVRGDRLVRLSQYSISKDGEFVDLDKKFAVQTSLALDLIYGQKFRNWKVWGGAEELKVFTLSDNEDEAGELVYGNKPLLRLQGEGEYNFGVVKFVPYAGIHKRSGYDFDQGVYGGFKASLGFLGDRIVTSLRAQVDKEHITIAPQFKLWVMQLDYSLKAPMSSTVDNNVKVSTIHNVNLRFFF